jgi:hypothetical protein
MVDVELVTLALTYNSVALDDVAWLSLNLPEVGSVSDWSTSSYAQLPNGVLSPAGRALHVLSPRRNVVLSLVPVADSFVVAITPASMTWSPLVPSTSIVTLSTGTPTSSQVPLSQRY